MIKSINILISIVTMLTIVSCEKYKTTDLNDWTEFTHGIHNPNYTKLFGTNEVHKLEITVTSEHWDLLIEDVERNHIELNTSPDPNGETESIIGSLPKLNYIPSNIMYDNVNWYKVGFRFKGLSSLNESWSNNILKMPIKLDFNSFGNIFEGIDSQRFYGFEKMTFANNFRDPSQIREKIAYELMESFGVRVPKSTFAEIYINNGQDGKKYFGLYTMIETIEDGMIHHEFGNTTGNCYKPAGMTATLTEGEINNFDINQKTNKGSDIDDVIKLTEVLAQNNRISTPSTWRLDLESIFEVNNFLKYLAANTVIQNWDMYGISSRNYYLYNQPINGKLIFIPWDLSESFDTEGKISPHLLNHSNVSNNWPLIKFLMADNEYYQRYKSYVADFNENYFIPIEINSRIDELYNIIHLSVEKEETGYTHHINTAEITTYIHNLKTQIMNRHIQVQSFY